MSVDPADASALRDQAIEVHTFEHPPTLAELAAAALEIRKRHPRLRLIVTGPGKLVRQLERRYPPLVDVPLDAASADAVLHVLETSQR